MQPRALLVGNSDGIGLAMTKRLLSLDWHVFGVSKSESPLTIKGYIHKVVDVTDDQYLNFVEKIVLVNPLDLCIYFAGIGELLNISDMSNEVRIIDVNLRGLINTASAIIPHMANRGHGHFIGISSFADELLSAEAPSYHASKAGFSNYLESLALAVKPKGVFITNVRFGFVDTKMAKGDVKPLMMSVERAVDHLINCIKKRPIRFTAPKIAIPLVKFRKIMLKLIRN
jgi:short-subunit dehydrogenase